MGTFVDIARKCYQNLTMETQPTFFLNDPPSETKSESSFSSKDLSLTKLNTLPATPEINKVFVSELNISLALPFKSRRSSGMGTEHTAVTKVCSENEGRYLTITTNSPRGAIGDSAYDVLNVLLDMAHEQLAEAETAGADINYDDFSVFYTAREICKRLGYDQNNSQNIVYKAIKQLQLTHIAIKGYSYNLEDETFINTKSEFALIKKSEDVSTNMIHFKKPYCNIDIKRGCQLKRVIFDKFIINSLSQGFGINKKNYFKLDKGKERRAYTYLLGKKLLFGDTFNFELTELAKVTGDYNEVNLKKTKFNVRKLLKKIEDKLGIFSYSEKTFYGKGEVECMIEFYPEIQESKYENVFFKELIYSYGEARVLSIFDEYSFELQYNEIKKFAVKNDVEFLELNKKDTQVDFALLMIDLAIYKRVYEKNEKSLRELIRMELGYFQKNSSFYGFPMSYKYLLTRNIDQRRKEKESKILALREVRIKEDEEKEEKARAFLKNIFSKIKENPKFYSKYKSKAIKRKPDLNSENYVVKSLLDMAIDDEIYRVLLDEHESGEVGFINMLGKNAKEVMPNQVAAQISATKANEQIGFVH